jgi:hypothetical protein
MVIFSLPNISRYFASRAPAGAWGLRFGSASHGISGTHGLRFEEIAAHGFKRRKISLQKSAIRRIGIKACDSLIQICPNFRSSHHFFAHFRTFFALRFLAGRDGALTLGLLE